MAEAQQDDITSDQTEKLLQFQDLTRIDDFDRCRELLQTHNWNIEAAVQSRFRESDEDDEESIHRNHVEARMPVVNLHPVDQRVFTFVRRPVGIMGWGYWVISFPFQFIYSKFLSLLRFAYRLLRPDPRTILTDPLGDVTNFIQNFEGSFGRNHPNFFRGTYSQALNEAKTDLKFLLVYLHGPDHQDTPSFCREVLCSSEVTQFVNGRMLFWACCTNSPEGYRVSQALRENTYPFLAIIVLRQNRMSVVARIEGSLCRSDLVSKLTEIMDENQSSLIHEQMEREERHFNQSLRQQQDEAYLESLRADQEKEKQRRLEQERREMEERLAQEREEEEKRLAQEQLQLKAEELERLRLRKEQLRDSLPAEPASDDPDTIRILLKLPNGVRLERRFRKTDSIKYLHDYVLVHEAAPDNFQIVKNFPRTVLPCQRSEGNGPDPPTFEEVGLGKSELLFVHDDDA